MFVSAKASPGHPRQTFGWLTGTASSQLAAPVADHPALTCSPSPCRFLLAVEKRFPKNSANPRRTPCSGTPRSGRPTIETATQNRRRRSRQPQRQPRARPLAPPLPPLPPPRLPPLRLKATRRHLRRSSHTVDGPARAFPGRGKACPLAMATIRAG